jgi:hypothetical protein
MPPAVFEKGLCDRATTICTLSQNGYSDRRVKARRCTWLFFVPLIRSQLSRAQGEEEKWIRGEQEKHRSSVIQDDKYAPADLAKGLCDRNSPICTLLEARRLR